MQGVSKRRTEAKIQKKMANNIQHRNNNNNNVLRVQGNKNRPRTTRSSNQKCIFFRFWCS